MVATLSEKYNGNEKRKLSVRYAGGTEAALSCDRFKNQGSFNLNDRNYCFQAEIVGTTKGAKINLVSGERQ